MCASIVSTIMEYSDHYDSKSESFEEIDKIHNLLCRYILKVGTIAIVRRDDKKVITLTVSSLKSIGLYHFEVFLDDVNYVYSQGLISFKVCKIQSKEDSTIETNDQTNNRTTQSFIDYASTLSGMIYVANLTSSGNKSFYGIGTRLMQIAAEVSQREGFGIKLCLNTLSAAPGFYRKLLFTTGNEKLDQAIDLENENAKKDERQPMNSFNGFMYLTSEGETRFEDQIAKLPILDR